MDFNCAFHSYIHRYGFVRSKIYSALYRKRPNGNVPKGRKFKSTLKWENGPLRLLHSNNRAVSLPTPFRCGFGRRGPLWAVTGAGEYAHFPTPSRGARRTRICDFSSFTSPRRRCRRESTNPPDSDKPQRILVTPIKSGIDTTPPLKEIGIRRAKWGHNYDPYDPHGAMVVGADWVAPTPPPSTTPYDPSTGGHFTICIATAAIYGVGGPCGRRVVSKSTCL